MGDDFEKGKLFLPQMIQSAQAAQAGFEEIKNFLAAHPKAQGESFTLEQRGIVLATVHGAGVEDLARKPLLAGMLGLGLFRKAVRIGRLGEGRWYAVEELP